jgi:hypothetical protein
MIVMSTEKLLHLNDNSFSKHSFVFDRLCIEKITEDIIVQHSTGDSEIYHFQNIVPEDIELNQGLFASVNAYSPLQTVSVIQQDKQLVLLCGCNSARGKLCNHQAQVLNAILKREELNIFFNPELRHEKLRKYALDFGLENEPDLDSFFKIEYQNNKTAIFPKLPGLMPVTRETLDDLKSEVIKQDPGPDLNTGKDEAFCVVFRQHKYYKHLQVELYNAQSTKEGKIKNPLNQVDPLDYIWRSAAPDDLKFFTGISKFQNHSNNKITDSDILALRAIIKNPLGYKFYYHNHGVSESITVNSVVPVR